MTETARTEIALTAEPEKFAAHPDLLPGEDFAVPRGWPAGTWGAMTSLGVAVANLHWKADPKKRDDPDWLATNTRAMDVRTIQREFELDWTIADGKPVFPDYDKERHAAKAPLRALPGLPVYVGWDFGLNPAAVFVQPDDRGQVRVLRALNEENKDLSRFAPMVLKIMRDLCVEAGVAPPTLAADRTEERARYIVRSLRSLPQFTLAEDEDLMPTARQMAESEAARCGPGANGPETLDFIHVGDPAGKSRSANDAKSAYSILRADYGIRVQGNQKHQVWDTRRNAVTKLLIGDDVAPGEAKFVVSPGPDCERLRAGFEGSYAYAEAADNGGREMPVKDRFSHPQDALQYVACHLFPVSGSRPAGGAVAQDYGPALTGRASAPDRFARLETATAESVAAAHAEEMAAWERESPETLPGTGPAPAAPRAWNPFLQSQMPF